VLARGLLRAILGAHLGLEPGAIRFVYGPQGKPAIADSPLRFNLSHSEDLAVCALGRDLELGVDVERLRPVPEAESIARRYFCPAECADLLAVSPSARTQAFFHCWTRKEAYVKALGGGLSVALDGFQVTLRPGEAARLVHLDGQPDHAAEWSLEDLPLASGFVGALAVPARGLTLRTWHAQNAQDCLRQLCNP